MYIYIYTYMYIFHYLFKGVRHMFFVGRGAWRFSVLRVPVKGLQESTNICIYVCIYICHRHTCVHMCLCIGTWTRV